MNQQLTQAEIARIESGELGTHTLKCSHNQNGNCGKKYWMICDIISEKNGKAKLTVYGYRDWAIRWRPVKATRYGIATSRIAPRGKTTRKM